MPNNDSNYIQTYNHPHGQVLINEQTLTDIADAIREQRLTDDTFKPAQFAGEIIGINEIEGGEYDGEIDLSVKEKDVNFYDYDGTRVYSYGKEEFLGLSSLPDNPSHDNLVAQGWNWSLSDAKEYVQNYGILDVGQMYNSKQDYFSYDYGYLQIDIELKEGYLSPVLYLATNATGEDLSYMAPQIYWGDGTVTGSPNTPINQSHTYSTSGKYTIVICEYNLSTQDCKFLITGTSSGSSLLTGGGTNDDIYRNCITDVRVGSCVTSLGDYAFKNCHSLRTISLHKDLYYQSIYCFQNCYSLKSIVLPYPNNGMLKPLAEGCFTSCSSLKKVILSSDTTINGINVFQNCSLLKHIICSNMSQYYGSVEGLFKNCHSLQLFILPKKFTALTTVNMFQNCYSLKRIETYCTIPPTITSTTFTGLPTYTKIYVPWSRDHSVLQAYKTATYWSDIADQIYQMPFSVENTQAYAEFDGATKTLTFFRDTPNKYTDQQNETIISSIPGEITISEQKGSEYYYVKVVNTGNTNIYSLYISLDDDYDDETTILFLEPGETWISKYQYNKYGLVIQIKTSINSSFTTVSPGTINVTTTYSLIYYVGLENINYTPSWQTGGVNEVITNVVFENEIKPVSLKYWFRYCESLELLDLFNLNTSNVTTMKLMFDDCISLTSLDLLTFDTSNVTDMYGMFSYCSKLVNLDVSHFNTSNVTDMGSMFSYCNKLVNLNLSNFNTSNVTNMSNMFFYCSKLVNLNLSNFNTSNVTSMHMMFDNCDSLIRLDLSTFDTSNVTDIAYMFFDCDNLERIQVLTNWNLSHITTGDHVFSGCTKLSGNTTSYDSSYSNDYTYARLDNPPNEPGYFTDRSQAIDERQVLTNMSISDWYQNNVGVSYSWNGNIRPTGTIEIRDYNNDTLITTYNFPNSGTSHTLSVQTLSYYSSVTNGSQMNIKIRYSGDSNFKPKTVTGSCYKFGNEITFKLSYNSSIVATLTALEGMKIWQYTHSDYRTTFTLAGETRRIDDTSSDSTAVYTEHQGLNNTWWADDEDASDTYKINGITGSTVIINNATYTITYTSSCCFEASTQILTSEGTKSIQDIDIGDTIILQNSSTGERTTTTALKVANIHYPTKRRAIVEFADGKELRYNPYHPIWTTDGYKTLGYYKDYPTLEVGDTIVLQDNTTTTVTNITIEDIPDGDLTTYNLLLAGVDDYYLEDEWGYFANDILVHHGVVNYYDEDEYRARHTNDCVNKALYENFDFNNSTDEEIINFIVELHSQSEDAYNEYMKYYLTAAQYRKFVTLYPEIKRRISEEVSS